MLISYQHCRVGSSFYVQRSRGAYNILAPTIRIYILSNFPMILTIDGISILRPGAGALPSTNYAVPSNVSLQRQEKHTNGSDLACSMAST